ncbi:MAG: IS1595 family transposase [Sphingosinicella sp.]
MAKSKAPTLRQFQDRFPTEESCLDHLFQVRYGTDFECPKCGRPARFHRVRSRRSYECQWCAHQVYPTAGTPFDRTRTPLRDWFHVMFLFTTTRNGVAAKRVERELGVTYKTAWRMCHEIRKYMAALDGNDPIGGIGRTVEIDEAFIGGYMRGGHGGKGKAVVFGMLEMGGDLVTHVVPDRRSGTLLPIIRDTVKRASTVHTDECKAYGGLAMLGYRHRTVNHRLEQYVCPETGATVNAIEGFWSALQRSIRGTHIHVSQRHLAKYLGEFEYRWNMRHVPQLMLDRLMVSFAR